MVINHPVVTSPDSASLVDPDGEILWRWGTYLTQRRAPQHVDGDDHVVELFHRPLGALLTSAADAGWSLECLIERGPSAATIERFGDAYGQRAAADPRRIPLATSSELGDVSARQSRDAAFSIVDRMDERVAQLIDHSGLTALPIEGTLFVSTYRSEDDTVDGDRSEPR